VSGQKPTVGAVGIEIVVVAISTVDIVVGFVIGAAVVVVVVVVGAGVVVVVGPGV
jgi:hypothetical protein